MKGILYLVATPIGNLEEISPRTIFTLESVDIIMCENPNNSIKFLHKININKKLIQINSFIERDESNKIIELIKIGKNMAYISDAGYPCISDPGSILVSKCIENDIKITVISGPCAFLSALIASGLDTTHFYFYGFLSSKPGTRKNEMTLLKDRKETLIFYESSHRIEETISIIYEVFGNRKICIARELTKLHEEYIRGNVKDLLNLDPNQKKGEFVIILEGETNTILDESILLNEVNSLVNEGLKTKKACELVSNKYNYSKTELYNKYHKSYK